MKIPSELLVGFVLCISAPMTEACSIAGAGMFHPKEAKFQLYTDPVTGYGVHPPAPEVGSVKVHRGTGNDGASCMDAGVLTVEVSIPTDSPYRMKDLGFYFRVLSGENVLAGHAVPLVPDVAMDKSGQFTMVWLDGAPSEQHPLDLEIEAFAIDHLLEIGPPTRFRVNAPIGVSPHEKH